jgi:hypothetical protein
MMDENKYIIFDVEGPLVAPSSQSPKEAAALKVMEMVMDNYVILETNQSNLEVLEKIALQKEVYQRVVGSEKEAKELLAKNSFNNRNIALLYWQCIIEQKHPLWDIMKTWMLGAIHNGEIKIEAYNGVEHIPSFQNEGFTLETLLGAPIFLQEAMLKRISVNDKLLYDCFTNFYSGKKMKQKTYEKVFADKLVEAYIADSIGELHLAKYAGAEKLFLTTTQGMNKETIVDAKSKEYHVVNSIEEIVYNILK